ncbi:ArsR family transcriptional regulator [Candidatus Woesearchaeota archaeon]|nr:ArsR family transcriptional regulator [Candidatus Woesearchaeota archaeon]
MLYKNIHQIEKLKKQFNFKVLMKEILEQIGLSNGETEIYMILLKIGESPASEISKHTKIARPNVYDYLNKLKEKGLVGFVNKKNKVYFIPSSPEKLLEHLEEKMDLLKEEIPALLKIYNPGKESSKVEVYEGSEGFKTMINDIIKVKKDFVGWGGSDKVKKYVPGYIVKRYLNSRKKYNIKGKMLFVEKESVLETPLTEFKSIPKQYSSPSTTIVYDNKVAIMIYTLIPLVIIITNRELADSYKKHFDLLWKVSKR